LLQARFASVAARVPLPLPQTFSSRRDLRGVPVATRHRWGASVVFLRPPSPFASCCAAVRPVIRARVAVGSPQGDPPLPEAPLSRAGRSVCSTQPRRARRCHRVCARRYATPFHPLCLATGWAARRRPPSQAARSRVVSGREARVLVRASVGGASRRARGTGCPVRCRGHPARLRVRWPQHTLGSASSFQVLSSCELASPPGVSSGVHSGRAASRRHLRRSSAAAPELQRAGRAAGLLVPPSGFGPPSTVFSHRWPPGLLHPGPGHEVHRVSSPQPAD